MSDVLSVDQLSWYEFIIVAAGFLLALATIIGILVKGYRMIVHSKTFTRAVVTPIVTTFETTVLELLNTHVNEMRVDMMRMQSLLNEMSYELHTNSGHSLKDGVIQIRHRTEETRELLDTFMHASIEDRTRMREMVETLLAQNEHRDRPGRRYESEEPRDPNARTRASDTSD